MLVSDRQNQYESVGSVFYDLNMNCQKMKIRMTGIGIMALTEIITFCCYLLLFVVNYDIV